MCLAAKDKEIMENNHRGSSSSPTTNSPPPSDLRTTSSPASRGARTPPPNPFNPLNPFGPGGIPVGHHGIGGSPRNSPPTLVPSSAAMSVASMASMLGHPPPFLHPGFGGGPHRTPQATDLDFMHKFMDRSFGNDSPPPTVPTNDPTANECKIVEYRGEKIAAFMIQGKTMLCLPQAFELFLKHLVGGLHTVYTKLKRLEITPIVCNVEQVRILRGLGAIQPGVNRCKLLADCDFDSLYKDCTTSRPGRPPKRGVPFPPMSPQDAMMHLKNMHNGANAAAGLTEPYKDGPYPKEPRLDKNPFGNGFGPPGGPGGINPMAAQFMALQHPAFLSAAQVNAAGGMPAPFGLPNPSVVTSSPSIPGRPEPQFMKGPNAASLASLEALQRSGFFGAAGAAYIERMREGQKTLVEQQKEQTPGTPPGSQLPRPGLEPMTPGTPISTPGQPGQPPSVLPTDLNKRSSSSDSFCKDDRSDSPILNLSSKSAHDNHSDLSADDDVYVSDNDDDLASNEGEQTTHTKPKMDKDCDIGQRSEDKVNNNGTNVTNALQGLPGPGLLAGLPGLLANTESGSGDGQLASVYSLITNIQALIKVAVENAKKEERTQLAEKGHGEAKTELKSEMDELKKNSQLYLRRFKKEKRYRRKLQEQLEMETKRRLQMEEALRMTSSETMKRITESLTRGSAGDPRLPTADNNSTVDQDKIEHGVISAEKLAMMNALSSTPIAANGGATCGQAANNKDRRDSGDDQRSSPASMSSTSNVAIAAAAAAAAAAAQFNATVSTSEASSDRGTPPRDSTSTTAATTTLGFAKNLFPQYNASSLFTSAN